MSIDKHTYGIVGYDLSDRRKELITEELVESKEYEKYTCFQREGKIQAFDDPMSEDYLYFGYIFFKTDESYEDESASFYFEDFEETITDVKEELLKCFGIIAPENPKVIVFNEYR